MLQCGMGKEKGKNSIYSKFRNFPDTNFHILAEISQEFILISTPSPEVWIYMYPIVCWIYPLQISQRYLKINLSHFLPDLLLPFISSLQMSTYLLCPSAQKSRGYSAVFYFPNSPTSNQALSLHVCSNTWDCTNLVCHFLIHFAVHPLKVQELQLICHCITDIIYYLDFKT